MFSLMRGCLPGATDTPFDVLGRAARHGASGVTFYSLFELSPTLDPGQLAELKGEADRLGLAVGASLDWLNPLRLDRHQRELALGDGDLARGIIRLFEVGAGFGMPDMFFTIGTLDDRAANWSAQLAAVADLLREITPALADLDMRALVKTHEEITSHECLALIEQVGPEHLGVSYDPTNMLVRIEDPLAAALRLAPHVAQVHIDDARLALEAPLSIRRHLVAVGDGILDWPALLAALPGARRLVELHGGQFAMPVFDTDWLASQPYIDVPEYARLLQSAVLPVGAQIPVQPDLATRLDAALALVTTQP
jgi:sugar phosphate isomerase/epimerase